MALYQEKTVYSFWGNFFRWGSLSIILFFLVLEIYYLAQGIIRVPNWLYSIMFLVFWFWRVGFDYIYSLDPQGIQVIKKGFGLEKNYFYPFADIQTIIFKFDRKLFKNNTAFKYKARYAYWSANPSHLVIVKQEGKKTGIVIKTTERFFKRMQRDYPEKFKDKVVMGEE